MATFAIARWLYEPCDVTLTAILSPLATVVREPLTSAPFFTSVQPVLGVRTPSVSNRQNENRAVTAPVAPATVTSLLVTTVLSATPDWWVKRNALWAEAGAGPKASASAASTSPARTSRPAAEEGLLRGGESWADGRRTWELAPPAAARVAPPGPPDPFVMAASTRYRWTLFRIAPSATLPAAVGRLYRYTVEPNFHHHTGRRLATERPARPIAIDSVLPCREAQASSRAAVTRRRRGARRRRARWRVPRGAAPSPSPESRAPSPRNIRSRREPRRRANAAHRRPPRRTRGRGRR